jgi:hypothetical protein
MALTKVFSSLSICSGRSTFFSMILTIAEPEIAPAAYLQLDYRQSQRRYASGRCAQAAEDDEEAG